MSTRHTLLVLAAAASLTACAPPVGPVSRPPAAQFRYGASPTVLTAGEVRRGGSLLEAVAFRIPSMRVQRDGDACPRLYLRGIRSLHGGSDPLVYVEDTRAPDTCILEQISTWDVDRVEVYSGGQAPTRPGIMTSPNGLILVYLRGG